MTALKPCPFCGGEAETFLDHTVEENHGYGCRACSVWFDTFNAEDAISAWNTRADTVNADLLAATDALLMKIADNILDYDSRQVVLDEMSEGARARAEAAE